MQRTLDAISAFLLKHPTGDFARGDLVFAPAIRLLPLLATVTAGVLLAWFAVSRLRNVTRLDRLVLGGIRTAVFLLLGFCLLRPTLVLSRAIAQRNVLAILLDDTGSMQVADRDGESRIAAMQRIFADSSELVSRLRERFAVRVFRAGSEATPLNGAAALEGRGSRTDLAASLASVRERLADLPLAGIVVVSDGAQNGSGDLEAELHTLAAREIPVHSVGVGTSRFQRDIGIEALRLPATVLRGGEAPGEVVLSTRGMGGSRAVLTTMVGGRLIHVDTLHLSANKDRIAIPVHVPGLEAGTVPVEVAVTPVDGEATALNNRAAAVLTVRDGPEKVLWVEGEPRPELAFTRRAAAADSAIQLVSLVRTGPGKLLRLGVDDSLELVNGFPARREELFRYRAVILGSIEASWFSAEQLRMLQDFVAVRGGGLLALGGRKALSEGRYDGTPVDEVLPLALEPVASSGDPPSATTVRAAPTASGRGHAALRLGADHTSGWDSLPVVTVVNTPGRPRPGATVLLDGTTAGSSLPLLTAQRYGRGKSAVFLAQDAWRWQLTDQLPEGDRSHAAFWSRMMRWMLDGVPRQVTIEPEPGLVAPGDPVELRARVADSSYTPRDDARVTARIIPPDAPSYDVALESDLGAPGEYRGSFVARSRGRHRIELLATWRGDSARAAALVVADTTLTDPGAMERDNGVLARIAEQTGGNAYDIDNLETLPDDVLLTRSGITAREASDLWDAPILFALLVTLLGLDWGWRRRRGLA
ncbi:MAG TPA: glutamine amidotransferase [Gemmatimonadales bacterium]|nr:glutamine amidotransferase [Gemmatimonadales bacterium]